MDRYRWGRYAEGLGEYAVLLDGVEKFVRMYAACPDGEGRIRSLTLLNDFLFDYPGHAGDLLIAESVRLLGGGTNQAVTLVADRYKLIIKSLLEEGGTNG
jgi:hypothetical protein